MTREGDRLFTQATGQGKIGVFPESDHDFFLKVIDAQITFETDGQGRATGLVSTSAAIIRAAVSYELAVNL